MDIFSEIIVGAVDKAKNAVVKIDIERLSGSGSGFVFSSDGKVIKAYLRFTPARTTESLFNYNQQTIVQSGWLSLL